MVIRALTLMAASFAYLVVFANAAAAITVALTGAPS